MWERGRALAAEEEDAAASSSASLSSSERETWETGGGGEEEEEEEREEEGEKRAAEKRRKWGARPSCLREKSRAVSPEQENGCKENAEPLLPSLNPVKLAMASFFPY